MFLSERSKFAYNPLEEDDRLADQLESKGKKIIRLNRGDPSRYFKTPRYIIDAYIKALSNGITYYSLSNETNELKEAIINRYRKRYNMSINIEDISITSGVSEALSFINSALIDPNDNAVIFAPYYPQYIPCLRLAGGIPIFGYYDEQDKWNVHIDHITSLLNEIRKKGKIKRVKYMLITNPNNPTGTVLRKSILEEIVEMANEFDIFLISDEIYDEIVYNGAKFTSVSELADGVPHAILNGASKVFNATGFRIGFVIIPGSDQKSTELKEKLKGYESVRLSPNTPAEHAVSVAMQNDIQHKKAITSMVNQIQKRVNHVVDSLEDSDYMSIVRPNGAFYIFPKIDLKRLKIKDDKRFVDLLLEKKGIQIVRGSGFGCQDHFRIVGLQPKEILDYAVKQINIFCKEQAKR